MKKKFPSHLNKYRIKKGQLRSDESFDFNGAFLIPYNIHTIAIVISDGEGWDHVSVSLKDRTPTWEEMCFVKDLLFDDDEIAVQYHPKKKDYVNDCNFSLHIWKSHKEEYPMPPIEFV
jgi:hypothetical protein